MLRYYAIATALVLLALALGAALQRSRGIPDAAVRYGGAAATPRAGGGDPFVASARPVEGDAPWALDALPECFRQLERRSGTAAFARGALHGARRVSDVVLYVADCRLAIGRDTATVERGENRLIVPASARFYLRGERLLLDRSDGARDDVRTYALRGAAASRKPSHGGEGS